MFKKLFKKQTFDLNDLIKFGVISALVEIIYIVLVAGFFIFSESLFSGEAQSIILGIMAMLILFVLSVAVSALLVFGIPLYFVVLKKYKEAGVVLASIALTMIVIFALIILGEALIY